MSRLRQELECVHNEQNLSNSLPFTYSMPMPDARTRTKISLNPSKVLPPSYVHESASITQADATR
jgi:hypothetical protein